MVLPARDGTVWVVDYYASRQALVRQHGTDGRYLRQLGAVGDGPGEYRGASGIAQLPDGRILLRDDGKGQIHVFSETGKYDTTWSLGRSYPFPVGGVGGLRADARGIVWVKFYVPIPRGNSEARRPDRTDAILRLRAADGAILDTVYPPAGVPTPYVEVRGKGAVGSILVPNTPRHSWAVHGQGFIVTLVSSTYALDLRVRPGD